MSETRVYAKITKPDGGVVFAHGSEERIAAIRDGLSGTVEELSAEAWAVQYDAARPKPAPDTRPPYISARLEAYPSIGDQLDALWKSGLLDALPADNPARQMQAQIMAVKAAHPKE